MNKILTIKYILAAVFIVFYHSIIAPRLSIAGIQSEIAIVFTIWIGLNKGAKDGALFGFAAGLLIGFFTPVDLGWAALILALLGYGAGSLRNKLVIEPIYVQLIILTIATFIYNLLFIFTTKFGLFFANLPQVLFAVICMTFYSAAVGALIFYAIRYRYFLRNLF
jgi:rod shape-determining protein MreD